MLVHYDMCYLLLLLITLISLALITPRTLLILLILPILLILLSLLSLLPFLVNEFAPFIYYCGMMTIFILAMVDVIAGKKRRKTYSGYSDYLAWGAGEIGRGDEMVLVIPIENGRRKGRRVRWLIC